ncbi:MAG: hypothetical protein AAGE65_07285 [Planctomycetota bacterium]
MPTRAIRCPAKLNLTLAVGPPDRSAAGRGRHPVVSLMVALDFGDTLQVKPLPVHADRGRLGKSAGTWFRAWADDAPHKPQIDWPLESDLLVRAHAAVQAAGGAALPVDATLYKRVPPGTGLGGGSADAAAMLHFLETHLAEHDAQPGIDFGAIAAGLGADVSFAWHALRHPGRPAALATGFGETLEPLALPTSLHAALVFPDFGCPTAAVYAAFDAYHPDAPPIDVEPARRAIRQLQAGATLADVELFNDLTAAAQGAQPKLAPLFESLRDAGLRPQLTGSGAAVFLPARDAVHAAELAGQAKRVAGHPARPVRTIDPELRS